MIELNTVQIGGSVAPGFEPVKALFEHNLRTLAERSIQLCIYHKGKKVVDLWGSPAKEGNFGSDSISNIFSSGKSLEAIALASLVSQGLLAYDKKISEYWPEFGAAGKGELKVADLMRHEAGLAAFKVSIDPSDLLRENIKQNKIGAIIESHPQAFREGSSDREYHAVTRGWIVNELFRRVDPKGRTIGEFISEDVNGLLGADIFIGVDEAHIPRVVPVTPLSMKYQFKESLKPTIMGRRVERNIFQTLSRLMKMLPGVSKRSTKGAPPPFVGMKSVAFFNDSRVVRGETPSANVNASARGLAKLAALMAAKGRLEDKSLISKEAWDALHHAPLEKDMAFGKASFTQGGVALFGSQTVDSDLGRALNKGREGFYGWLGLGGSIFQWHPEHDIGFAYVPTSLNILDLFNERGKTYQAEVLRCVENLA